MKQIIEPAKKERAIYSSDFSDQKYNDFGPPVELQINFNYGSRYDGAQLSLHLDDNDIESILEFIKKKINHQYKAHMTSLLDKYEKQYNDAMDFREWEHCDLIGRSIDLIKYVVDYKDND